MQLQRPVWSALVTGSAFLAALGANAALKSGWRHARHEEPPSDPASPELPWQTALAWVVLSSLTIATVKLLAMRGAARGLQRIRHETPPSSRLH